LLGLAVVLGALVLTGGACGIFQEGASSPGAARTTAAGAPAAPTVRPFVRYDKPTGDPYLDRFMVLWNDLHDPKNGYFSTKGIPYHSAETLIVEAPDYGHETTSEAYSYWIWLEAMYGRIAKDWSYLTEAWASTEAYMIPSADDQPSVDAYDPSKPATFTPELDDPAHYPAALDTTAPAGSDPIGAELRTTYGTSALYGMHWLLDVDDWYGFGRHADGKTSPSLINTFQRGPLESVWETIPQPCWDGMNWGGPHGYLDLFVRDSDTAQWKYSVAPDADARAIEAVYWALRWADEAGSKPALLPLAQKAAKLGDYLRYSFFDKYFKPLDCASPGCSASAADGRGGAHYLLSWYYAWGAPVPPGSGWSWRIGSSWVHSGYQNPMAAFALASVPEMHPRSPRAAEDWNRSLVRQLEFYKWLQSAEGGIAGGATSSWAGAYAPRPAGDPTFYGMSFDPSPVFRDPPSNEWFGFQTWSMERVAELYYVTADKRAETIVSRWVAWVLRNSSLGDRGSYRIPSKLNWSGKPAAAWNGAAGAVGDNPGLHVTIEDSTEDVGTAASVARTLMFWAARSRDDAARAFAKELLDRSWARYKGDKGVSSPEVHKDYSRFAEHLVVPSGWKGKTPHGAVIDASSTFLSIRPDYAKDPSWPKIDAYLKGGEPPKFAYHRFWAQSEIALANATYGWLFPAKH
jgi:Glycosyl hydrolase family 48